MFDVVTMRTPVSRNLGTFLPGDPSIAAVGSATAGATLHYQAWYRDPAAFCTTATFDLTNGLEVTWTP